MADIVEVLENNFSQLWPDWLMLNISRTRVLNEVLGNPSDAMIIQVVCWHHLLVTSIEKEKQTDTLMKHLTRGTKGFLQEIMRLRKNV